VITTSVILDLVLWALFWGILMWSVLCGLPGIRKWLKQDADARDGIQNFPRESLGEQGPQEHGPNVNPQRDSGSTRETAASSQQPDSKGARAPLRSGDGVRRAS